MKIKIDTEIATGHLEASGMRISITNNDDGGILPLLRSTEGVQIAVDGTQSEKDNEGTFFLNKSKKCPAGYGLILK